MTMTTDDLEMTEYLEGLARFTDQPTVDLDARWTLTVAGLEALGQPSPACALDRDPVRFISSGNGRPGRWIVDQRPYG